MVIKDAGGAYRVEQLNAKGDGVEITVFSGSDAFNRAQRFDLQSASSTQKQRADDFLRTGAITDQPQLGRQVPVPISPEEAQLDRVPNPHPSRFCARFVIPEMTSLCPVTGAPDFATLVIDYAPVQWLIESKSLKLYISSFRNHKGFHEQVTVDIGERLVKVAEPLWLRIVGFWNPRGGIAIHVAWESDVVKRPQSYIPDPSEALR